MFKPASVDGPVRRPLGTFDQGVVFGDEPVRIGDNGAVDGDQLHEVLRDAGVTVAYLFGSRAAGTARQDSDYDLAVLFDHAPTLREVGELQSALARLVNAAVDIVELDRAPLELQGKVVQEGRLVFSSDEPRRVRFETTTRSRWFDFRPVQRELTRAYLRRVAAQGL